MGGNFAQEPLHNIEVAVRSVGTGTMMAGRVGFLVASLLLHGAVFGGLWWHGRQVAASEGTAPMQNSLQGSGGAAQDLFEPTLEAVQEEQQPAMEEAPSGATASPDGNSARAPEAQSAGHAAAHTPSSSTTTRATARSGTHAGSAIGAAPSATGAPSGMFGAVGERGVMDLSLAFVRAFPQAASTDPVWPKAALGDAGTVTVRLTINEAGKLTEQSVSGGSSELQSSVSRTMPLLRSRTFTARQAVTTLVIRGTVTKDDVHDGLHGDVFAIGGSMSGSTGQAFFALAIGRRVDVHVTSR